MTLSPEQLVAAAARGRGLRMRCWREADPSRVTDGRICFEIPLGSAHNFVGQVEANELAPAQERTALYRQLLAAEAWRDENLPARPAGLLKTLRRLEHT